MDQVNNNQFEIKPNPKAKRKIAEPCPNVYLNPALDILANDDPMCNNAMEIVPNKKKKGTTNCDIAAFENTALDIGISKAAVNEFLLRELENVRKNLRISPTCANNNNNKRNTSVGPEEKMSRDISLITEEPIYANVEQPLAKDIRINDLKQNQSGFNSRNHPTVLFIEKVDVSDPGDNTSTAVSNVTSIDPTNINYEFDSGNISNITNTTNVTNNVFINKQTHLNLSFIERLGLDSPNISNNSLYLDDDLNESNIMEIKTITIITKKKRIQEKSNSTNPFLNNFDTGNTVNITGINPFLNVEASNIDMNEMEYNGDVANEFPKTQSNIGNACLIPRRLFSTDTNCTVSTGNESLLTHNSHNEYENIDALRSESPIYENIDVEQEISNENYNKQSKILGHDVRQFSAIDIMNLNKISQFNSSDESNDSKKDLKHQFLKASNKLSKKVFKTLKKTFKVDKPENNVTLNPYEVPRKPPKKKIEAKETGIENPGLNLDNSDEIEFEELDDEEHQYETIKTLRNTQLNMNVTPLRESTNDNIDDSNAHSKTYTPGKKVRFDSTLNQEKIISGNSFDYDIASPGFDVKIEKYHDELENCINERKFIQQNM